MPMAYQPYYQPQYFPSTQQNLNNHFIQPPVQHQDYAQHIYNQPIPYSPSQQQKPISTISTERIDVEESETSSSDESAC